MTRRQQGLSARRCGFTITTAGLLAACFASASAVGQETTQTFTFDNPLDVGSGLGRVGDPDRWEFDLGTSWDEDFRLGAIIGKKNTTIIPEVKVFGKTIIPKVTADTRTGARFTGNINGSTGLLFYADYDASGVEAGSAFSYAPQVTVPDQVFVGEFTSLSTNLGLVDDGSFTEELVDLPSFEAGMDFYFNLDLQTKIEAGLFPILPYKTTNWDPAPINVNQSLLKFEFDLDPDSNPSTEGGIPPTFTMLEDTLFETQVGLLDNGGYVQDKQISVEVESGVPGVKTRVDIGEVQVINPFGTDAGGFLGNTNERNLKIGTSLADDKITYTAESAILRLGLDLDGIAAYLGTGQSFTRLEEEIGVNPFDPTEPFAEIIGDFIDIKYGPEIGYRETVDVKTDFNVTLTFKDQGGDNTSVALDDNGSLTIGETWTGKWSELPEIAILGTEDVDVEVEFIEVTGEQTKRGVFYLTDYLQLTLLELESLNILDIVDLSLPPVYQGRTSLLGALLGEFELEVTNKTEAIDPFAVSPTLAGGAQFTLNAAPTVLVYSANGDGGILSSLPGSWRRLADGTVPTTLDGTTIFVGFDNMAQSIMATSDTDAMTLLDAGGSLSGGTATIAAAAIQLPNHSTLRQFGGERIWDVARIANDGTIESTTAYTQFGDGSSGVLQIIGDGTIVSSFGEMSFQPNTVLHGPGHTIRFENHQENVNSDSGPFHFLSNLVNAGTIHYKSSDENSGASITNTATGAILATDGSFVEFFNGSMINQGLVLAAGDSTIIFNQGGTDTITAPGETGVFTALGGSLIRFKGTIELGDLDNNNAADASKFRFEVGTGGEIDFEGEIHQAFGTGEELTEFDIAPGGTLRLNGIRFPDRAGASTPDPTEYSSFFDVRNFGTIIVESGQTFLMFDPDDAQAPGVPPSPPRPVAAALNLVNQGEIIIQDDAQLSFEVEVKDYAEGGAAWVDGEWTLEGAVPGSLFSNQTDPDNAPAGSSILDIRVVSVSNFENILSLTEFGDTNGDGEVNNLDDGFDITTFDTELSINAATVTLSGRALFPYFNTVEENEGTINLRNYQNFITAGDLLNTGTINIESNARLDVQGKLAVGLGGVVNVATTTIGANQLLDFNTLEIVGGTVNTNAQAMLNEGLFTIRVDGYRLVSGISIIVREDTAFAEEGVDPVTTPGVLNMIDSPGQGGIARSDGTIVMDGADAVFDLAKHLRYNHGTLEIRNGHVWQQTNPADDFRNAPGATMLLQAGQFIMDGTFRNDGDLTVDSESYLKATTFTNGEGAVLTLDGVVEADLIDVDPGSTVNGSGRFSGTLAVDGAFSPGNSAGRFEIYQDMTLSNNSELLLELDGTIAGESYDQVFVDGTATFDGLLTLDFQDDFYAPAGFEWLLVEAEQSTGTFDTITSGLPAGPNPTPTPRYDPSDVLIGAHNGQWLLLSYFGGDGNDLVLYVPTLRGDIDADGDVDDADFGLAFAAFTGPNNGPPSNPVADLDGDGDVDDADFGLAFASFTGPNAPVNIPEPSSLALIIAGGLLGARRRRRL